jgi:hypothetical protein
MIRLGWDASALAGGLYAWREKYPVTSMDPDVIEVDRQPDRAGTAADVHL